MARLSRLVTPLFIAALTAGCGGGTTTVTATVTESASPTDTPTEDGPPLESTPAASPSQTPATQATQPPPATFTVTLFFQNETLASDPGNCSEVLPVDREVTGYDDPLEVAVRELLAGPNSTETAAGYTSWFSSATSNALIGATVDAGKAYLNFVDFSTVIPNASTSCGSAQLLASLDQTVLAVTNAIGVRYAFDGDPRPFWEWLQMSCDSPELDNCDPAPFPTS